MTDNSNDKDPNNSDSHELIRRDKDGEVALNHSKDLLAITNAVLARSPNTDVSIHPDNWMRKLWAWADEFNVRCIPRDREALINKEQLLFGSGSLPEHIDFPSELSNLHKIKKITINNLKGSHGSNISCSFPKSFSKFNLQEFFLNNVSTDETFDFIYQIRELEVLHIQSSVIPKLSESISNLQNLSKLSFAFSDISFLPPSIGELRNLEYLSLTGTSINSLPNKIIQLKNLKKLRLDGCKLNNLSPDVKAFLRTVPDVYGWEDN